MAQIFEVRGDTAANWTTANPVLAVRQEAVETDTLRRKIGDGATAWTSLPYATALPADVTAAQSAAVSAAAADATTKANAAQAAAVAAIPPMSTIAASPELRAAFVSVVTPEAHGAKGDGRFLADVTSTAGSAVITSPSAGFTSGDVGKVVWIRNGTGVGLDYQSTIVSWQSATQVTLSALVPAAINGAWVVVGTDDTATMQAAIDAAMAANTTLLLGSKMYVIAGAPRTDRSGNAVLALNTNYGSIGALTLEIQGIADAQGSWIDNPQGSVIFAPLLGQTYSATYGPPSVLGGPTTEQIGGTTVSRADIAVRNVFFCLPQDPTLGAMDFDRISRAYVDGVHCGVATDQNSIPLATHPCGVGVRMPGNLNFERVQIGTLLVDGYYIGGTSGEHLLATQLSVHQCRAGWSFGGTAGHVSHVDYISMGRVTQLLTGWSPSAGVQAPSAVVRFLVDLLDCEDYLTGTWPITWHVNDPNSMYRATIRYSRTVAGTGTGAWPLQVNGGAQVHLVDASVPTERRLRDSSPSRRHATLNGDPSVPFLVGSPVAGFGNALRIPGVPGSNAPFTSSLAIADGRATPFPFTVECRFSPDAISNYQTLIAKYTSATPSTQDFIVYLDPSGHLNGQVRDGSGTAVTVTGTSVVAAGSTHAVAVVADGTNLMLYVDGTREASAGLTSKQANDPLTPLCIGGGSDGASPLVGVVDEIRLSSTARYTGASYALATVPFTSDASTVALYHCDELS